MGMNEISETMEQKNVVEDVKEEGKIMDSRNLNNLIDNYLKNKKD
jgi:hypothetical protein